MRFDITNRLKLALQIRYLIFASAKLNQSALKGQRDEMKVYFPISDEEGKLFSIN